MGRLSSDDERPRPQPHQSMGIMAPATKKVKEVAAIVQDRMASVRQVRIFQDRRWRYCPRPVPNRGAWRRPVFLRALLSEYSTKFLSESYPIHDIQEKVAAG